ncbi:hypothetical protein SLA_3302 [Streptomyces laurentii]|uniref:Uncharacterized protein n=1 Tax=Streptomyces laurentii TaxID=39478 RepID=A0A160P1H1_STRLU|nr:hypothetical protein SLA_3302 [Streptomyces laurentii]
MSGELERGGEGGAHAAGSDDSDGEPGGAVLGTVHVGLPGLGGLGFWGCVHGVGFGLPFQSAGGTGRFLVMLRQRSGPLTGCPRGTGRGRGGGETAGETAGETVVGGRAADRLRGGLPAVRRRSVDGVPAGRSAGWFGRSVGEPVGGPGPRPVGGACASAV